MIDIEKYNELLEQIQKVEKENMRLTAKLKNLENNDGLDGAVVYAIRELLQESGVPTATFIDDHVHNLVIQRNEAKRNVEILMTALKPFAEWTIGGKIADDPENRQKYPLLTEQILNARKVINSLQKEIK